MGVAGALVGAGPPLHGILPMAGMEGTPGVAGEGSWPHSLPQMMLPSCDWSTSLPAAVVESDLQ